jgi:DNA-directed RNA polymerase subunit H (RpoH/RPB5)
MYKIYEVLFKFCEARGYETKTKMSKEDFTKSMMERSVLIPAKKDNKEISIILLSDKHGAMSRQDDMKKILRNPGEKIIIAGMQPKSNIVQVISRHPDLIYVYSRKAFLTDIRNNVNVPKHSIADESELPKEFYNKDELPNIMLDDPQVVWLGAEVGDLIRIDDIDKNTGIEIHYRVVRK